MGLVGLDEIIIAVDNNVLVYEVSEDLVFFQGLVMGKFLGGAGQCSSPRHDGGSLVSRVIFFSAEESNQHGEWEC